MRFTKPYEAALERGDHFGKRSSTGFTFTMSASRALRGARGLRFAFFPTPTSLASVSMSPFRTIPAFPSGASAPTYGSIRSISAQSVIAGVGATRYSAR